MDIALKCRCGRVRGEARGVAPDSGNRLVCMCDDCQAYAHYLGRPEILDVYGGTEVFQMTPSQIRLTEGLDHVRCVRLGPQGLLRWFAGCCNTPVANTLPSPRVPFAGVVRCFIDGESSTSEIRQALGPIRAYTHARYAVTRPPEGAHPRAPVGLILRSLRLLLGALIRGAHAPSPFFDRATAKPVAEPLVLSAAERARLTAHPG